MRLIVRSSGIHAAGCFTLDSIPKGTQVVEYTGERMPHDDADRLYDNLPYTYLFGTGDGVNVIDGYGIAMYVNHSCDPNCETEEADDGKIWIQSIREIAPGEELTYDYLLYEGDGQATCTCGAKTCRGTMYSPAEVRRMKRAAAKKKKAAEERKKKAALKKKAAAKNN